MYLDRAVPLRDPSGAIIKWFGTCTDIDDQMHTQQLLEDQIKEHTDALSEANARLRQESIHGPLTGLYNRRYLEDVLGRETRRSVRAEHGLSVIMLDLAITSKGSTILTDMMPVISCCAKPWRCCSRVCAPKTLFAAMAERNSASFCRWLASQLPTPMPNGFARKCMN